MDGAKLRALRKPGPVLTKRMLRTIRAALALRLTPPYDAESYQEVSAALAWVDYKLVQREAYNARYRSKYGARKAEAYLERKVQRILGSTAR